MGPKGYPRSLPCGTCGGDGIIYVPTKKIHKERIKVDGKWEWEEIEVMELIEKPCGGCRGTGTA